MTGPTPEIYFSNLPEIEALPFDLRVSVHQAVDAENLIAEAELPPHHAEVIRNAMDKTSGLFGVALQVWKDERRRAAG